MPLKIFFMENLKENNFLLDKWGFICYYIGVRKNTTTPTNDMEENFMEALKNFANGRLSSMNYLEDIADKKALYNQVFGACEFHASLGEKQMKEAKEIWEDFSWRYLENLYK